MLPTAHRNKLTGNTVIDNRGNPNGTIGVSLVGSSNNRVEFNSVNEGTSTGILVGAGSARNELIANVSSRNRGPGFDLAGSSSNTLLRNNAVGNESVGFVTRSDARRNKLLENAACLNRPSDATDESRSNGNLWLLNLFCKASF